MRMSELVRLNDWAVLERILPRDLLWFMVYEAVCEAREKLHVQDVDQLELNRRTLFLHTVRYELMSMLEKHVLKDAQVELTLDGVKMAMDYFALKVPEVPTFQLDGYLNYLEAWSAAHEDWTVSQPEAFEDLDIEISI